MTTNIGYSSIYPNAGQGAAGPQGSQGPTGPNQTVPGSTGATGLDSNYITEILVNNETGEVTLVFSDDTLDYSAGILTGATGIYAGITALSLGGLSPILRGVCGGITLDFYNFQAIDLIGLTYDSSGNLKFTISPNTTAGGISADTENNRIVYAKGKTFIMSTDMIPQVSSTANSVGNTAYHYINFGGETAGRNVVTDITENLLTVGPVGRGGTIVSTETFFTSGPQGICLDVSRGSVFKLISPIGIAEFNTKNSPMTDGQIMSVTLVIEGDDVWNFPSDVYFDQDSGAVFYPGTNILHMWKGSTFDFWNAHFTARGLGINSVTNPGLRGSCCYFDADGTKHCEDYVTENYCIERSGTFEGLVPCTKNSCVVSEDKQFDGICCSEGRCISDIDPDLCQTIGGYFISGITCGILGSEYPETAETDNYTGICYNKCKPETICCRDGECLGNLTKIHCEEILGGKIVNANSCTEARCCDHVLSPGACCIPQEDGSFECVENVQTPYECNVELGGVYMGKNTNCQNNICCKVPTITTCYECVHQPGQCIETERQITEGTCADYGYNDLPGQCNLKQCHKCDCVQGCTPLEVCGNCPVGYTEGSCIPDPCTSTKSKTCYSKCGDNIDCEQETFEIDSCDDRTCQQLVNDGEITNINLTEDRCECNHFAACFWCFPIAGQYDSTGIGTLGTSNVSITEVSNPNGAWADYIVDKSYAPYRSVVFVNEATSILLENSVAGSAIPSDINVKLLSGKDKTVKFEKLQSSNKYYPYYEEIPSVDVNQNPLRPLGSSTDGSTTIPEVIGPVYSVGNNVKFKCYYVSNYEFLTDDADSIKKEKCLKAIGYDTSKANEAACELCDQLSDIDGRFYPQPQSLTFTNLEPYHNDFKSRKLFAPFPPVWGRITYNLASFQCGGIGTTIVQDTAAFGGLFSPVSNTTSDGYGGLYLLLDHAHGRETEPKLKDYWQSIIDEYKKSFRNNSNIPVNYPQKSNLVTRKITNNLNELLGNNTIVLKSDVPTIPPALNPPDNNYNQQCVVLWNPAGPTDYLRFDPYLHGLNYSSLSGFPYSGYIQYNRSFIYDCSQCFKSPIAQDSWFFISPGNEAYGKIAFDFDDTGKRYYPETGNYSQNSESSLDGVGEIYHFGYSTGSNKFELLPIIYGRNIRYNLDRFRTSSVFFDSEDQKTMKYSPITVIPIGWANIYSLPPELAPAQPCGIAGPIDTIPVVCHSCGEGPAESGTNQCCANGCLTGSRQASIEDGDPGWAVGGGYDVKYCTDICTACGDPNGCPPNNPFEDEGAEVNTFGILAPSNSETTTGGGAGSGFRFASVDSGITTKRVELTPGICVDMLCPECNNYESC